MCTYELASDPFFHQALFAQKHIAEFMLLIRSQIYNFMMYLLIFVIGIIYMIPSYFSRKWAFRAIKAVSHINAKMIKFFCNIDCLVEGIPPQGTVLICSKHMSFLDILMLADALPEPNFIMKDQLKYVPILGAYARFIGAVPVKRGAGQKAVDQMMDDLNGEAEHRQIVIYPQGTRVLPGQIKPYKRGAAVIYQNFNLPCYMVATNVGVLWARKSAYRYPGTAVIKFIDERIEVGMDPKDFMEKISTVIEHESNLLMEKYPRQDV